LRASAAKPLAESARGWSTRRRTTQVFRLRLSASAERARVLQARRLPALHLRLFCPRGSASGRGRSPMGPRSGQLSPPFVRAASSHSRQPLLVGADCGPRPPDPAVTSRSSGRRRHPTPGSVLQNAPRGGGYDGYIVL